MIVFCCFSQKKPQRLRSSQYISKQSSSLTAKEVSSLKPPIDYGPLTKISEQSEQPKTLID